MPANASVFLNIIYATEIVVIYQEVRYQDIFSHIFINKGSASSKEISFIIMLLLCGPQSTVERNMFWLRNESTGGNGCATLHNINIHKNVLTIHSIGPLRYRTACALETQLWDILL